MEKKETVLELINGDKDGMSNFSLALEDMEPKERPSFFEELFLRAIRKFKDEPAYKFFIWLMQSLSDLETEKENGFNRRVEKAKELCLKLPPHEIRGVRIQVAQDESRPGTDEFPTLLKTREAILTEIVSQCFRTKSEEETKILLYFLLDLPTKFKEEKELIRKVIQNTDSTANTDRLERCFEWTMNRPYDLKIGPLHFPMVSDEVEEIAHVLAKGWVRYIRHAGWRRSGLKELLCRMRIFRPLINSSDGAKEFVERISKEVARIDGKVQILANRLKQPRPNKFYLGIQGDIETTYDMEGFNLNNITVAITPSDRIPELEKIELLKLTVDRVREWKNEGENASIRIRLVQKMQGNTGSSSEIGTF